MKSLNPNAYNTVKSYDHPLSSRSLVISQEPRALDVSENPLKLLTEANLGAVIILRCVPLVPINNCTNRDNVKSSGLDVSSEAAMRFPNGFSSSQMSDFEYSE